MSHRRQHHAHCQTVAQATTPSLTELRGSNLDGADLTLIMIIFALAIWSYLTEC
jgi:hypothetical protein